MMPWWGWAIIVVAGIVILSIRDSRLHGDCPSCGAHYRGTPSKCPNCGEVFWD